jgi:hypothetical protein
MFLELAGYLRKDSTMRRLSILTLSLVVLQSVILASEGKQSSGRQRETVSSVPSSPRGKPGPVAYAIGFNPVDPTSGAQFGLIDIGAGIFLTIADLPQGAQGIARDNGQIFAVDSTNNLVRIDPGNGKTKLVGPTGITTPGPDPDSDTRVDVIAALETGDLFLMDYSNNLYSVDRKTGAARLIGPTGIPPIVFPSYSSSLAGDCHSLFFTLVERDPEGNVIVPPTLYRIDPRNAATTLVGPTARAVAGSGFINGTLYGFSIDLRLVSMGMIDEPPHVFSIDTKTGAATRVTDLNVPGVGGAVSRNDAQGCKEE